MPIEGEGGVKTSWRESEPQSSCSEGNQAIDVESTMLEVEHFLRGKIELPHLPLVSVSAKFTTPESHCLLPISVMSNVTNV